MAMYSHNPTQLLNARQGGVEHTAKPWAMELAWYDIDPLATPETEGKERVNGSSSEREIPWPRLKRTRMEMLVWDNDSFPGEQCGVAECYVKWKRLENPADLLLASLASSFALGRIQYYYAEYNVQLGDTTWMGRGEAFAIPSFGLQTAAADGHE